MSYSELLKHPLWQRKRLEIMNRASFTCEWCGATESTLHVHHTAYHAGRKPWEYEDAELQCICEHCHTAEHVIEIGLNARRQFETALRAPESSASVDGKAKLVAETREYMKIGNLSAADLLAVSGVVGISENRLLAILGPTCIHERGFWLGAP